MDIVEKLLSRIKVNAAGCFEWQSYRDEDGYGRIRFDGSRSGAHRVSYRVFRGDFPRELLVCHHCDNPCCINPAHLFLGTVLDNSRDSKSKNRHAHGASLSHLTDEQIVEMVSKYNANVPTKELEKEFGVTDSAIQFIVHGRSWKHVPREPGRRGRYLKREDITGSRNPKAKLSDGDVKVIREKRSAGWRVKDLAIAYGVCKSSIERICNRQGWSHVA